MSDILPEAVLKDFIELPISRLWDRPEVLWGKAAFAQQSVATIKSFLHELSVIENGFSESLLQLVSKFDIEKQQLNGEGPSLISGWKLLLSQIREFGTEFSGLSKSTAEIADGSDLQLASSILEEPTKQHQEKITDAQKAEGKDALAGAVVVSLSSFQELEYERVGRVREALSQITAQHGVFLQPLVKTALQITRNVRAISPKEDLEALCAEKGSGLECIWGQPPAASADDASSTGDAAADANASSETSATPPTIEAAATSNENKTAVTSTTTNSTSTPTVVVTAHSKNYKIGSATLNKKSHRAKGIKLGNSGNHNRSYATMRLSSANKKSLAFTEMKAQTPTGTSSASLPPPSASMHSPVIDDDADAALSTALKLASEKKQKKALAKLNKEKEAKVEDKETIQPSKTEEQSDDNHSVTIVTPKAAKEPTKVEEAKPAKVEEAKPAKVEEVKSTPSEETLPKPTDLPVGENVENSSTSATEKDSKPAETTAAKSQEAASASATTQETAPPTAAPPTAAPPAAAKEATTTSTSSSTSETTTTSATATTTASSSAPPPPPPPAAKVAPPPPLDTTKISSSTDLSYKGDITSSSGYSYLRVPIIVDNGSGSFKAGFSGDLQPQLVVSSTVACYPKNEYKQSGGPLAHMVGSSALHIGPQLCEAPSSVTVNEMLFSDNPQWDDVELAWEYLLSRLSDDYSEHPILMTQPCLAPLKLKSTMQEILYEKFGIRELFVAEAPLLSAYAYGHSTGLVVEVGHSSAQIVPCVDGYVLGAHVQRVKHFGGYADTKRVVQYFQDHTSKSDPLELSKYATAGHLQLMAQTIKDRLCVCPTSKSAYDDEYAVMDEVRGFIGGRNPDDEQAPPLRPHGVTLHRALLTCGETCFSPQAILEDEDASIVSIQQLCANVVAKCDVDTRNALLNNVFLSGQVTTMPGFDERLLRELKEIIPHAANIKVHGESRRFAPWVGGSVLASLDEFASEWRTKDDWEGDH